MKYRGRETNQGRSRFACSVTIMTDSTDDVIACRIYKGIVNYTAKQGYRADLRQEAVARASAILKSSQPKKEAPEKKVRGSKAKKAAEKDSS